MTRPLFKASIENAFYFSFASFLIAWAAGFLFQLLEKTPGRLNLGVVIILVLSLILIIFFLSLVNILLGEHSERERLGFFARLGAILLFIILAALILGVLGLLFVWQF
ncbi:hypothetical protein JW826_05855 [Candidatus Woesearchaeota archaeon]|nr:hypothetical protein [Candidatus Woesearchaeota archaeon]